MDLVNGNVQEDYTNLEITTLLSTFYSEVVDAPLKRINMTPELCRELEGGHVTSESKKLYANR